MLRIPTSRKKCGVVKIGFLTWRGRTSFANKCFFSKNRNFNFADPQMPQQAVSSSSNLGAYCWIASKDAAYCILSRHWIDLIEKMKSWKTKIELATYVTAVQPHAWVKKYFYFLLLRRRTRFILFVLPRRNRCILANDWRRNYFALGNRDSDIGSYSATICFQHISNRSRNITTGAVIAPPT